MKDRLREALERLAAEWDERDTPGLALPENQEWAKGVDSGYGIAASELRDLLTAHPTEPAPVASRERVAEVVRETMSFEPGHAHGLLLTQQANRVTHRLLQSGVVRDEAEVKAEAVTAQIRDELEASAGAGIHLGDEYLRGMHSALDQIDARAKALRAGDPS